MIAKLKGLIESIGENYLVIDVNGVGYLVSASGRTLSRIGKVGEAVSLEIETNVREDQISLFGFADMEEKQWFKLLCTVQGVGARVALAILAVIPVEQLAMIIAAQDKASVSRADGVGPKLATRIVTELKDKAGKMALSMEGQISDKSPIAKSSSKPDGGIEGNMSGDAVSALVNLGYNRADAFGAVMSASKALGEDAVVGDLIRESLKELGTQ